MFPARIMETTVPEFKMLPDGDLLQFAVTVFYTFATIELMVA